MRYVCPQYIIAVLCCQPYLAGQPVDETGEWHRLIREGARLLEAGQIPAAAVPFEAARKLAETFEGGDVRLAISLNNIGTAQALNGDHAAAIRTFEEAERRYPQREGMLPLTLLDILANKAYSLRKLGRLEEAMTALQRAAQLEAPFVAKGELPSDNILHGRAWIAIESGNYEEAREALQEELVVLRKKEAPDVQVAAVLGSLGHLHHKTGEYAKAETYYRRTWELRRRALPRGHVDLHRTVASLAMVLLEAGYFDRAENLLRQTLKELNDNPPANDADLADCLANLASILTERGRYAEAERLARRALAIYEGRGLGESTGALAARQAQAIAYRHRKRYQEAERVLREIIGIRERRHGTEHPELVRTHFSLAILLTRTKRFAEAEAEFQRAVQIAESKLGPAHLDLAIVLASYAELLKATKRSKEARELRERSAGVAAAARVDRTGASMVDIQELKKR